MSDGTHSSLVTRHYLGKFLFVEFGRFLAPLTSDLRPLTSEKRRRSGLAFRDSPYA